MTVTDTPTATTPTPASTPSRKALRRRRVRRLSKRDKILIAVMVVIPLLLDLALIWGPAIATVWLSTTNAHGIGPIDNIGGQNFHVLRTIDPDFWPAVRHNLLWLAEFTVIATPIGVLLAVLIDRGVRGSRIYQSIFYLPVMLSLALIGIIWNVMYNSQYGFINGLLHNTAPATAIDWLGNPHLNLWSVLIEATWRQAGYVMVLYLAGLKAFDPALREAAVLDGANEWQLFWKVTFPTLRPINNVIVVITVIESLRAFDLVYVTNGGVNGLQLLSAMITQQVNGTSNAIGYGSAIGVVLLVISLVPIIYFLIVQFRKDEQS